MGGSRRPCYTGASIALHATRQARLHLEFIDLSNGCKPGTWHPGCQVQTFRLLLPGGASSVGEGLEEGGVRCNQTIILFLAQEALERLALFVSFGAGAYGQALMQLTWHLLPGPAWSAPRPLQSDMGSRAPLRSTQRCSWQQCFRVRSAQICALAGTAVGVLV